MAYTPGLEFKRSCKIKKLRELPLKGRVHVKPGDLVTAKDSVLSASLPGDLQVIRLADRMLMEVEDVVSGIKVKEAEQIKQGDLLCEVRTFFGLFKSNFHSPTDGVVEFITTSNAHIGIRKASTPLEVNAYIDGVIVEVEEEKSVTIEANAALIQGIFGVGGERQGEILVPDIAADKIVEVSDLEKLELSNKIIIAGSSFSKHALFYLADKNVSAVITGSIDAETLASYVGYEIGVSITGDEEVPFSLIVTEGFGKLPISKRVLKLAREFEGKNASINGATQVRAGAMRPEIIIPHMEESGVESLELRKLEVGTEIRIIRVPYFGKLARVSELPHAPEKVESGAVVRVLRAELEEEGGVVTVPRANVEIV